MSSENVDQFIIALTGSALGVIIDKENQQFVFSEMYFSGTAC